MSSVRNIAVAQPYVEPCNPPPASPPCWPAPLPAAPVEEPWIASLDAVRDTHPNALANLWEELVLGRIRPLRETTTRDRVCLLAQVIARPSRLNPEDTSLVVSVLCGEARKALASELGIAISTATGRILRALTKLELSDRNLAMPLVLAAQSWAGVSRIPSAKAALVDHEGCPCLAVSVPRPMTIHLTALTRGEQEVAQWLIEGLTRHEIADRRETSMYTVARQFHSVFAALRVTGRYALIRRAVELRCFHQLGVAEASEFPLTHDSPTGFPRST
jgi:DNA-binding NarL/FixJ family response regulator